MLPGALFAQQMAFGSVQSSENISLWVGFLSSDFLLDGYHPGRPTIFDYNNKGKSGFFLLTYKHDFGGRVSFGGTITMEQQHGDWQNNVYDNDNPFDLQTSVKGVFNRTDITLAPEMTGYYLKNDMVRLYMVVGLGATLEFETDEYDPQYYNAGYYNGVNKYGALLQHNDKGHLNIYYAPFGFSIGRTFSYYFEMGFGYKGVINTGLSYKF